MDKQDVDMAAVCFTLDENCDRVARLERRVNALYVVIVLVSVAALSLSIAGIIA